MKVKKRVIVLAVLLGLITMSLLYVYIESKNEVEAVPVELSNVVVAVTSIPAHVAVTPEMVAVKSLPAEAVHPDAVTSVDEIVGFTTNMAIYNDEQILKSKVVTETQSASLSYRIPENMRAMTIPMSEITGVGGYIVKGDKVDILVTYNNPDISPTMVVFTQFQNVEILEKGPGTAAPEGNTGGPGVTSSLTILISPSQAEVLTYALGSGSINMTLRNPVDETINNLTQFGTEDFATWRGR